MVLFEPFWYGKLLRDLFWEVNEQLKIILELKCPKKYGKYED
jgi:hypothetical protein